MRSLRSRRLLGLVMFVMVAAACGGAEEDGGDGEAGTLPGEGVTVVSARPNWDTAYFDTEIVVKLLEELGYEVTPPEDKELAPEVFYPSLARHEVDFWAEGWFTLHDPFFEEEVPGGGTVADNVTIVGSMVEAGALQGYLVDAASAEEHGITSVNDLTDPATAEVYDRDGNGKADLIGCNEGWGCAVAINDAVEQNDWDATLEHVQGEYSALMVDTLARFERGEPVLYYTWTPNWTVGALVPGEDVVWLEAPSPEGVDTVVEGVSGCVADPCEMGFPPNDLRVVANNEFLEENPAAATLFELIEIPVEEINAQNLKMNEGENTQADIERHADEWIEANRDLVDGWLEEARAAAG